MKKLISFNEYDSLCWEYTFDSRPGTPHPDKHYSAKCPECGTWLELTPDGENLECLQGHTFHT